MSANSFILKAFRLITVMTVDHHWDIHSYYHCDENDVESLEKLQVM